MTLLVDTSVWSLAYRRDTADSDRRVAALRDHLERGEVATTGMVYLELLRGFTQPEGRARIETAFDALIAQLCIANDLVLLPADDVFLHAARHVPLNVWTGA